MIENKILVGVVDDHTLFREGLINLLHEYGDISVVFSANNGEDLKKKLTFENKPLVVLMDIYMRKMDGHASTLWLKSNYPEIHVLALSMYEDEMNIIKMLRNGAGGYILKESNPGEVVRGIRSIALHAFI